MMIWSNLINLYKSFFATTSIENRHERVDTPNIHSADERRGRGCLSGGIGHRNTRSELQPLSSSQRVVNTSVRDQYQPMVSRIRDQYQPMASRSRYREHHSNRTNRQHKNSRSTRFNPSSVRNPNRSKPGLSDAYIAECWSMWKTIASKSRVFLPTETSSGELKVSSEHLVHSENSGTTVPVPRRTALRATNTEHKTGASPLYQNANRVNFQAPNHKFDKPRYFDRAVCAAVPCDGDYSDLIIDALNNDRNIIEFVEESSLDGEQGTEDHRFHDPRSYIDRPIKGVVDYADKLYVQTLLRNIELYNQYSKNNEYYGGDLHFMAVGKGKEYLESHGRVWNDTFNGIKARSTGIIKQVFQHQRCTPEDHQEQRISVTSIALPFKNRVLTAETIENAYEHILALHSADGLFFSAGRDPRELTFVSERGVGRAAVMSIYCNLMSRAALTSDIFDLDEELQRMMLSGRRDRGELFIPCFQQFFELRKALQKGISELSTGMPAVMTDTLPAVDFSGQHKRLENTRDASMLSRLIDALGYKTLKPFWNKIEEQTKNIYPSERDVKSAMTHKATAVLNPLHVAKMVDHVDVDSTDTFSRTKYLAANTLQYDPRPGQKDKTLIIAEHGGETTKANVWSAVLEQKPGLMIDLRPFSENRHEQCQVAPFERLGKTSRAPNRLDLHYDLHYGYHKDKNPSEWTTLSMRAKAMINPAESVRDELLEVTKSHSKVDPDSSEGSVMKTEVEKHRVVRMSGDYWPDHGAISPEQLKSLTEHVFQRIEKAHSDGVQAWINCNAGQGRSATLAVALQARKLISIYKEKLKLASAIDMFKCTIDLVKNARLSGGHCAVQTEEQFGSLVKASLLMAEEQGILARLSDNVVERIKSIESEIAPDNVIEQNQSILNERQDHSVEDSPDDVWHLVLRSLDARTVDQVLSSKKTMHGVVKRLPQAYLVDINRNDDRGIIYRDSNGDIRFIEGDRSDIARGRGTPAEALIGLVDDRNWRVREALARNRGAPAEALIKLAEDKDWRVRYALAYNEGAPAKALIKLAGDQDRRVRRSVADNEAAPAKVLIQLAGDQEGYVREAVFDNINAPAEALIQFARDQRRYFRAGAARHPNTPEEVLIQLADDQEVRVREDVASNPNAPEEVLIQLADDQEVRVREGVASNPNAPEEVLIQLADDQEVRVREAVASHPSAPKEVLIQLADDQEVCVRAAVASHPNAPKEVLIGLASDEDEGVREAVANHPSASKEVLIQLADDQDVRVRQAVASHPNAPEEVLIKLADDRVSSVRAAVARNENAPAKVLIQLAGDQDSWVREKVASNSNTPAEVLIQLAGDPKLSVRLCVACNRSAPAKALIRLSREQDWRIQYVLTQRGI